MADGRDVIDDGQQLFAVNIKLLPGLLQPEREPLDLGLTHDLVAAGGGGQFTVGQTGQNRVRQGAAMLLIRPTRWARPVPATGDRSEEGHAHAARSVASHPVRQHRSWRQSTQNRPSDTHRSVDSQGPSQLTLLALTA
ncbi:hypothetical protein [Micromonospora sp. NPDC049497]|uniref:hypothetical protein n=1 Tax=Micromonospora sp. NPDC049497 TaxID=3364273 RepID=UPI0037A56CEA